MEEDVWVIRGTAGPQLDTVVGYLIQPQLDTISVAPKVTKVFLQSEEEVQL